MSPPPRRVHTAPSHRTPTRTHVRKSTKLAQGRREAARAAAEGMCVHKASGEGGARRITLPGLHGACQ